MTLARDDRFTLVEALDRLIDKGVSVSGDVTLSVADIDLVYLGVRLLLCSADEVPGLRQRRPSQRPVAARVEAPQVEPPASPPSPGSPPPRERDVIDVGASAEAPGEERPVRLLDMDPDRIEKDLCRLVLTLVELIRQLMERQAIRRMDGSTLREEEIERLGLAFARLDDKMVELREVFGLRDEELNIDLGPLGSLV